MKKGRNPKLSIQERFDLFHGKHPEVFESFVMFTRELVSAGCEKCGARKVIERIRWEMAVNPEMDEGFKVNDNFISRYARLYMEVYPQHKGFFETRKLKA